MELSGGRTIDELNGEAPATSDVAGRDALDEDDLNETGARSGTLKPRASRRGIDKGTKELDKQFGRLVVDEGKSRYGESNCRPCWACTPS